VTINFSCEHCGKVLKTSDDKAGLQAKCPGCGQMVVVPPPEGGELANPVEPIDDEYSAAPEAENVGKKITCPMCGKRVSASASECEHCGEALQGGRRGSGYPVVKGGHDIIDIGDVLSTGWRIFNKDMGTTIGVVLVAGLLNIVASIPQQVLNFVAEQQGDRDTALILSMASLLFLPLTYAVQFYLQCGQAIALLKIVRGEPAQIGDLFTGGRYFWRSVGATLVFGLMLIAGFILCIVPGIIVSLMFAPFLYVLVDEDSPGIDCLWRAKALTQGNKASYFVVMLACFGINIVGVIALCIGVIFTAPLTVLITAVAYCKMAGQRTA